LLLWYTSDEPDGNSEPLNGTRIAYDKLRALDPYKPVSLVLNCYNFHFQEYTSGADIIMEDAYPISTNLTWSSEWNTPCNTTYGDCGCDDCFAPPGSLVDIRGRYAAFNDYAKWLGSSTGPPKSVWGVPQAFGGSQYWTRPPTATEEAAMAMLRVNQGAKGIVAWTWPTTDELANVTGKLAKMLTAEDVTEILLSGPRTKLDTNLGGDLIDVAIWIQGDKALVSIVAVTTEGSKGKEVILRLPKHIRAVKTGRSLWGPKWELGRSHLTKSSISGLEVSVFWLDVGISSANAKRKF
jgi:hypothetical protein